MLLLLLVVLLPLSSSLLQETDGITFISTLSLAREVEPLTATQSPIIRLPPAGASTLRNPKMRFLEVNMPNGDSAAPTAVCQCDCRHCPDGQRSKMVAASQRGYAKRAKRQIRRPAQCNCCLCGRGSNRNPYPFFPPKDDLERRRAEYDRAYAPYPRDGGQLDYADDYTPPAPLQISRPYAANRDSYPRFRSYAGDADAPRAAAPPAYADFRTRGAFGTSTREDPYPYEPYASAAPARFRSAYAADAYADTYPPPKRTRGGALPTREGDPYAYADAYYAQPPSRPRFRSYASEAPDAAVGDPYAYPEEYQLAPPARPRFRAYGADVAEQSAIVDPYRYAEEYQPPPARPRFRSYGAEGAVEPVSPVSAGDLYSYPEEDLPPAYPLALPKRG